MDTSGFLRAGSSAVRVMHISSLNFLASVTRRILCPTILLVGIATSVLAAPLAREGVSSHSYGRFGTWLELDSNWNSPFALREGDLFCQVYPDHLSFGPVEAKRDVWETWFGWADDDETMLQTYSGAKQREKPYLFSTAQKQSLEQSPRNYYTGTEEQADVRSLYATWVFKEFGVLRRRQDTQAVISAGIRADDMTYSPAPACDLLAQDFTYLVGASSTGPGTWISSKARRFFVEQDRLTRQETSGGPVVSDEDYATRFTHLAYSDGTAMQVIPLVADAVVVLGSTLAASPHKGFVLLLGGHPSAEPGNGLEIPRVYPLMVSFDASSLQQVYTTGGGDYIVFDMGANPTDAVRSVALSFPHGRRFFQDLDHFLAVVSPGSIFLDDLVTAHRMAANQATQIVESFELEADWVRIRNEPQRRTLPGASPYAFAVVPPLVEHALTQDTLPVQVEGTLASRPFLRTKFGGLKYIAGQNELTYRIPRIPSYAPHAVRLETETESQALVSAMMLSSLEKRRTMSAAPFSLMNNRGESYSFFLASEDVRKEYLLRMRDIIQYTVVEDHPLGRGVLGEDGGLTPDDSFVPELGAVANINYQGTKNYIFYPPCGDPVEMKSFLWRGIETDASGEAVDDSTRYPWDSDATAGTVLEFIEEYAALSNDTNGLASALYSGSVDSREVDLIARPLELTHDWGYMAASGRLGGGAGAHLDMLAAQFAGLGAWSRLERRLAGSPSREAYAAYLQAKVALPMCLRMTFLEEAPPIAKTMPTSVAEHVLTGFGEYDLTGPDSFAFAHYAFDDWSDWTLSGERVHPIAIDAMFALLKRSGGTPLFPAVVSKFDSEMPLPFIANGSTRGSFPESKYYAMVYDGSSYASPEDVWELIARVVPRFGGPVSPSSQLSPMYWGGHWRTTVDSNPKVANLPWFTGTGFVEQTPASLAQAFNARIPSPIYPAMVEHLAVPIRVGGWTSSKINDLYLDASGGLHIVVEETSGTDTFAIQGPGMFGFGVPVSSHFDVGSTIVWSTGNLTIGGITSPGPSTPKHPRIVGNLINDSSFTSEVVGDGTFVQAWSGPAAWEVGAGDLSVDSKRYASVVPSWDLELDNKSLRLVVQSGIPSETTDAAAYAHTAVYAEQNMSEVVHYRLRFNYRVDTPETYLKANVWSGDRGAVSLDGPVRAGGECIGDPEYPPRSETAPGQVWPYEHSASYVNGSAYFEGALKRQPTQSDGWVVGELTGSWNGVKDGEAPLCRPGRYRVDFRVDYDESAFPGGLSPDEKSAWVDDVEFYVGSTREDVWPVSGTLSQPEGGSAFRLTDNVPVSTPAFGPGTFGGFVGSATPPCTTPTKIVTELSYFNATSQQWIVIEPSALFGASTASFVESGKFLWGLDPSLGYTGPTRLRARFFDMGPDCASLADREAGWMSEYLSEWFVLLPEIASYTGLEGANIGLDLSKAAYAILTDDLTGDGAPDVAISRAEDGEIAKFYWFDPGASQGDPIFQSIDLDGSLPLGLLDGLSDSRGLSSHVLPGFSTNPVVLVGAPGETAVLVMTDDSSGGIWSIVDTGISLDVSGTSENYSQKVWSGSWGPSALGLNSSMLYLSRSNDVSLDALDGFAVMPADIAGQGQVDVLLEWDVVQQQFVDRSSRLPHSGTSETISAVWGFANDDDLPDLFVPHLGPLNLAGSPGWSQLLIQQGDGTFVDATGTSAEDPVQVSEQGGEVPDGFGDPGTPRLGRFAQTGAATWADFDGDKDFDLVLGRQSAGEQVGEYNLVVALNNGDGYFSASQPGMPVSFRGTNAMALIDLDANGYLDILLSNPSASTADPVVLMGYKLTEGATYVDRGADYAATIGDQTFPAAASAAFREGFLPDLILGRPEVIGGSPVYSYFKSDASAAAANLVTVRLEANGSGNPEDGTGARVFVRDLGGGLSPHNRSALISAGSSHGQQESKAAVLSTAGLSSYDVLVRWPDGYEQVVLVSAGQDTVVTDNHQPGLVDASVSATFAPSSGYTSWKFKWSTLLSASDHEVVITDARATPPSCVVVPAGQSELVLRPDDPNVELHTTFNPVTGRFDHELVWYGVWCAEPCNYKYVIRSKSGTRVQASTERTLFVSVCADVSE